MLTSVPEHGQITLIILEFFTVILGGKTCLIALLQVPERFVRDLDIKHEGQSPN